MATNSTKEIDVWTGIINPDEDDMPVSDANTILRWQFNDQAKRRMEELATRNGEGKLTDSEQEELEAFVHVGQVVAILQAKARIALNRSDLNSAG
jgi:hypothetical protein